jgi:hypothetical protein
MDTQHANPAGVGQPIRVVLNSRFRQERDVLNMREPVLVSRSNGFVNNNAFLADTVERVPNLDDIVNFPPLVSVNVSGSSSDGGSNVMTVPSDASAAAPHFVISSGQQSQSDPVVAECNPAGSINGRHAPGRSC